MTPWSERRAVVLGAQGSLGQAIVAALAAREARVCVVVRRTWTAEPQPAEVVLSDLSRPTAVTDACRRAAEGPVDALFVASGAFAGGRNLAETSPEVFEGLVWANLRLPFYAMRELLGPLRAARGRAVLIGALAATDPRAGQAAYAATKAALHSMVQAAARELEGSGAAVNALLPTVIDTPANRRAMPGRDPSEWIPPAHLAEIALRVAEPGAAVPNGALMPVRR